MTNTQVFTYCRAPGQHICDVFATGSELEGARGLGAVVVGGGAVHKHQGLGVPADRVGHEHGERVVSVRDVGVPGGERCDDSAQRGQRLVDAGGFLQLVACGSGLGDPLHKQDTTRHDTARTVRLVRHPASGGTSSAPQSPLGRSASSSPK